MFINKYVSLKGQTLIEYALILAFIAVVAISVLVALGETVNGVLNSAVLQGPAHYWEVTAQGQTWDCSSAPVNVPLTDATTITPIDQAPLTIHGGYTVQEITH